MKNLLIRGAKPDDSQELIEVVKEVSNKYRVFDHDEFKVSTEEEKEYLAKLEDRHLFLVAIVDNMIVGWLDLYPNKAKFKRHVAGLIIGLLDEYQHQGIGSQMLQKAIDFARDKKIVKISTEIAKDNLVSQNLVKKHSFKLEGTLEKHLFIKDGYIDNLIFGKIIPDFSLKDSPIL